MQQWHYQNNQSDNKKISVTIWFKHDYLTETKCHDVFMLNKYSPWSPNTNSHQQKIQNARNNQNNPIFPLASTVIYKAGPNFYLS